MGNSLEQALKRCDFGGCCKTYLKNEKSLYFPKRRLCHIRKIM
jgi:hypothetical protein